MLNYESRRQGKVRRQLPYLAAALFSSIASLVGSVIAASARGRLVGDELVRFLIAMGFAAAAGGLSVWLARRQAASQRRRIPWFEWLPLGMVLGLAVTWWVRALVEVLDRA